MMGICKRKGNERGLWYEIKCLEENIALKKTLGKDVRFEESLLRSYRKSSEKDYASQPR